MSPPLLPVFDPLPSPPCPLRHLDHRTYTRLLSRGPDSDLGVTKNRRVSDRETQVDTEDGRNPVDALDPCLPKRRLTPAHRTPRAPDPEELCTRPGLRNVGSTGLTSDEWSFSTESSLLGHGSVRGPPDPVPPEGGDTGTGAGDRSARSQDAEGRSNKRGGVRGGLDTQVDSHPCPVTVVGTVPSSLFSPGIFYL